MESRTENTPTKNRGMYSRRNGIHNLLRARPTLNHANSSHGYTAIKLGGHQVYHEHPNTLTDFRSSVIKTKAIRDALRNSKRVFTPRRELPTKRHIPYVCCQCIVMNFLYLLIPKYINTIRLCMMSL